MQEACPHCGQQTDRRERFCEACGAYLGWDEEQPADSQELAQPAPPKGEQRAGVQIRLENDLIEVTAGGAKSTAFMIKNFGTKVEEFRLSAAGPEWMIVEPAIVSVYPGQEAKGTVQAAPPRAPSSAAGVVPFRLTVTSALHSHVSGSAAGRVDIALTNRGNTPLRVLLNPTDVGDGLRLSLAAVVEMEPGEVTEVPVAVHGRRRWFGRAEPNDVVHD